MERREQSVRREGRPAFANGTHWDRERRECPRGLPFRTINIYTPVDTYYHVLGRFCAILFQYKYGTAELFTCSVL